MPYIILKVEAELLLIIDGHTDNEANFFIETAVG